MIITEEIIELGKSVNGGWSLKQMNALGMAGWKQGWKRAIIGRDLDEKNVTEFLALKNAHKIKTKQNHKKFFFEPITANLTYADQYKHPNWQKTRLIVLKRDDFKCVGCHSRSKQLHVHHLKYGKGKFIWDVPHWYMVTLCEECHAKEHNF